MVTIATSQSKRLNLRLGAGVASISTRRRLLLAALSVAAGLAHFWVFPEHRAEWWGYGLFFLTAGLAQILFASLLLRSHRPARLVIAGIAGNLTILATYVISRTVGVPVGPHAHDPEQVGRLDFITTLDEIILVAALASTLSGATRRRTFNALLAMGALVWLWRIFGLPAMT
ncbi:MAG: hypothetical protein ABI873_19010 [Marmoricola sp.]